MRRCVYTFTVAGLLLVALSSGCCTPARAGDDDTRLGDNHAQLGDNRGRLGNADARHGLRRCTLLIPLAYNDGTAVAADVQTRILDRLLARFGGYTVAGTVAGAYRMADGTRADDRSLALWVAVPAGRVDELRQEAAKIARELRQECVYFEVSGGAVEFVGPGESEAVGERLR